MYLQDLQPGDLYRVRPADPIDPALIISLSTRKDDANELYGTIRALVHRYLVLRRLRSARSSDAEEFFVEVVELARCSPGSRMTHSITAGSVLALAHRVEWTTMVMLDSTAYHWGPDDEDRLERTGMILEVHMRAQL